MSLFPNRFPQNCYPCFYNTSNPLLSFLPQPNQYFYLTYPQRLLQPYPTVFLTSNLYQSTFLTLANTEKTCQEKVQVFQKELLPQQNWNNDDSNLRKESHQICVKDRNREQVVQLSEKMLSKSGNDRFIKKNTESNIINQIFSFLWSPDKSQALINKIVKNQNKTSSFYGLMTILKANCKNLLNRNFLKHLTQAEGWEALLKKLKKKLKEGTNLQKEQLGCIVRKLTFIYLREVSRYSIMTSKKMNHRLWNMHFQKCHEMKEFLFSC